MLSRDFVLIKMRNVQHFKYSKLVGVWVKNTESRNTPSVSEAFKLNQILHLGKNF